VLLLPIAARSTFPGAGRYTAHWTGDNAGNWENLFYSIAGVWDCGYSHASCCDAGTVDAVHLLSLRHVAVC
jgi:hypothetical protein